MAAASPTSGVVAPYHLAMARSPQPDAQRAEVERDDGGAIWTFAAEALHDGLAVNGIGYQWFAGLGGRRRAGVADDEGSAWRHPSFRAYAQHLRSQEFAEGFDALLHVARASRTAVMCSELLWWRCHRRLIADVLVFTGWRVTHIMTATDSSEHRLAAPVRVSAAGLSYVASGADRQGACC